MEKKTLYEAVMKNRPVIEKELNRRMEEKRNRKAEAEEERDLYNKFIFRNIEKNLNT